MTRNVTSPSAKALQRLGAELVCADLDDTESLKAAFEGAQAIFATTDFFALTKDPNISDLLGSKYKDLPLNQACFQHELQQGQNVISAAGAALADAEKDESKCLETFVLSTLSHAAHWSKGNIKHLLHFDVKAEITEFLRTEYPKLSARTNFLQVGFYMSNIWFPFLQPQKTSDGSYVFRWPPVALDTILPATDPPKDVGIFVRALVSAPHGTVLLGESDRVTVRGLIALWGEVTGRKARLESVSVEQAAKEIEAMMPGGWGQEFAENMLYYRDYGYEGGDPAVKRPLSLGIKAEDLTSYRKYLEAQDWSAIL